MFRARLHATVDLHATEPQRGATGRIRPLATLLLVSAMWACHNEPTPPPTRAEIDVPTTTDDVLKQLGEVVAYHDAGDTAEAVAAWENAQRTYSETLAPRFRSSDAARTLQVEYRLGQLRRHLGTARGNPTMVLENIESDLDALAATAAPSGTP